jgi:hypothetical protein
MTSYEGTLGAFGSTNPVSKNWRRIQGIGGGGIGGGGTRGGIGEEEEWEDNESTNQRTMNRRRRKKIRIIIEALQVSPPDHSQLVIQWFYEH